MGLFNTVGKAISSFFGGEERPTPNNKPNGGDGVQAYGGYLQSPEQSHELQGSRKWVTYANARNTAIVATGLRYSLGLLAGTTWHAEPNPRGGRDAARAVDIVDQGLINAQLPRPWSAVVRKAALYKFDGFSLHEWTTSRRSDGMIVFADIAHRPQYTIERWNKPSEKMPWDAVEQLTKNGNRWTIPRGRMFYCVDDTLTDSPDGVGLMRHIVDLVRKLGVYEGLEGLAFQTDLRGMPIGRAPIKDLIADATAASGSTASSIEAYVRDRTAALREALQGIVKSPDKLQYLLFDSTTYRNADQSAVSDVQKWAFDLLKGESNGLPEIAAAIGRVQLEISRVLGIEFAMVGGNDSAGSHGMHTDKTDVFAQNLQTTLTEVADFATNDLARVLVGLNGLDPETCTPRLVAEPISTEAIESVCRALATLAQAALQPDDPAIPVIRARMHLPVPLEPSPEMMGVIGRSKPGPPDPTAGEEDIPVDDLGSEAA